MKVRIPTTLYSYTGNSKLVDATGTDLGALLLDLDRQFPGIRFRLVNEQDRIREHIKIAVNQEFVSDLGAVLQPSDQISIIMAISGG